MYASGSCSLAYIHALHSRADRLPPLRDGISHEASSLHLRLPLARTGISGFPPPAGSHDLPAGDPNTALANKQRRTGRTSRSREREALGRIVLSEKRCAKRARRAAGHRGARDRSSPGNR